MSTDSKGPAQIVVVVEDGLIVSVQGYRVPSDIEAFVVLVGEGSNSRVTLEGKALEAQVYHRKVWPMGEQFDAAPEPGVIHAARAAYPTI